METHVQSMNVLLVTFTMLHEPAWLLSEDVSNCHCCRPTGSVR